MKTIKGPGIFLAQFLGDKAPFNTLEDHLQMGRIIGIYRRTDSFVGCALHRS